MKTDKITLGKDDCAVVLRADGSIDVFADEDRKLGFTTDNALAAIFLAHYAKAETIRGLADELRAIPVEGVNLQ